MGGTSRFTGLSSQSDKLIPWLISSGVVTLSVAVLGGNRLIAVGHTLIILALMVYLTPRIRPKDAEQAGESAIFRRKSFWALLILTVAIGVSMVANWSDYPNPIKDFKKIRYEILILILCGIPVFRNRVRQSLATQKWCIALCFGSAAIISLAGIYALYSGVHPFLAKQPHPTRVGGISGTVMTYAYSMQFLFLFCVAALLAPNRVKFLVTKYGWKPSIFWGSLVGLVIVYGVGIWLSQSRGALLGIGCGGLALLILLRSKWLWVLAIVGLGGLVWYGIESRSLVVSQVSSPETIRKAQWKAATFAFMENPVFGLGYRQFEKQSAELKIKYGMPPDELGTYFKGHAHNNFLGAFASTGIIGGLSFIAFCLYWFHELTKSNHTKIFFLPLVVAFMVSGLFESTFIDSEVLNTVLLIYFFSQVALDGEAESTGRNPLPTV